MGNYIDIENRKIMSLLFSSFRYWGFLYTAILQDKKTMHVLFINPIEGQG